MCGKLLALPFLTCGASTSTCNATDVNPILSALRQKTSLAEPKTPIRPRNYTVEMRREMTRIYFRCWQLDPLLKMSRLAKLFTKSVSLALFIYQISSRPTSFSAALCFKARCPSGSLAARAPRINFFLPSFFLLRRVIIILMARETCSCHFYGAPFGCTCHPPRFMDGWARTLTNIHKTSLALCAYKIMSSTHYDTGQLGLWPFYCLIKQQLLFRRWFHRLFIKAVNHFFHGYHYHQVVIFQFAFYHLDCCFFYS